MPQLTFSEFDGTEHRVQGEVDKTPDSRLVCQIQVTEDLDGMVVRWPQSQV